MVGDILVYDSNLSFLERLYVRILGAPISGLRVRFRRMLPELRAAFKEAASTANDSKIQVGDFGCGMGVFSFEIAQRFPAAEVCGFDCEPELVNRNLDIAERAGIPNCTFEEADILEIDNPGRFDISVCVDNLEHIEDDRKAMRRIHESLKEGGRALFHVPGYHRRWVFFSKEVNFDVIGHVRPGYTLEEFTGKLKDAGFEIAKSYYSYGWLETVTNNISYLITGADKRNKYLYALVFPFLNFFAFWGQWARPAWGAGVIVVATKGASE